MPDTGHSVEEGDFPGTGSGGLLGRFFIEVPLVSAFPRGILPTG
jgi:hypothetical protein